MWTYTCIYTRLALYARPRSRFRCHGGVKEFGTALFSSDRLPAILLLLNMSINIPLA